MTNIGIPIAFLAGILSFASPCCLPLVPGYVSYMVATSPDTPDVPHRRVALFHALAFVAGFSVVFIALWASIGLIGYLFHDYVGLLRQIGGAVLIFMGLHVAGLISIPALYREKRLPMGSPGVDRNSTQYQPTSGYGRSALLGVVFSAGWTPCIGPILGGIIGLASVSASVAHGALLLFVYAIGLGIPFVLVALGATAVSDRLGWVVRHEKAVGIVTGGMLVAIGFLMITNTFGRLSGTVPLIEV